MRFSFEDADKYGSSGSKINFLSLKDDGDKAYVHLLGNDMNDFPGYAVHRVKVGDSYRYVNCLREAGAPVTDCPFCAEGKHNPEISKVYAKLFIPVYDCNTDEVKIFERGKNFFRDLSSYCSHNPNVSELVTEIERRGKKNDTATTYGLYATRENDNFDMKNVAEDIPNILGDIILDKTFDEMTQYVRRGEFPSDNQSEAGVTRRETREASQERRTPSRRNSAEDEY